MLLLAWIFAVIFVVIFLVVAFLVVSIISLLVIRVPYVNTPRGYMLKVLEALNIRPGEIVYDLGCGNVAFWSKQPRKAPADVSAMR